MFAKITDDLPYSHIWSSCQDDQHRCTFVDGQDFEVNVPDEDKKLYNILAKTDRNADANGDVSRAVPPFRSQSQPQTKKLRLFGSEIDSGASDSHGAMEYGESSGRLKSAYGGGTNWGSNKVLERQKSHDSDTGKATTHCLLLQKNLPELLMLGCLRCLAPGDEDKRYFVSPPAVMECQFALRYTTTKTPEEVEQNCKSACGPIRWGTEKDCLVVIAYNSIKHEPSHAISYLGFSYFEVKVTHMDTKKDECVKCARSQVDSDFRYIGETARHFYMYATKDTFQKLQGCLDVGVCENIEEEPGIVPYDLSNFKYLLSPGKESAASSPDPPGEIRTATYYCMHQSSYHNSKKQEEYPLDFPARSDFHAFKKKIDVQAAYYKFLR